MNDEIINLTQSLVKIDTTGGKTEGAVQLVGDYLERKGISVKYDEYKNGCINLETSIGNKSEKAIVMSGHLDVVPVGDPNKWTYNPFSGKIVNGELWGRGSVDMKGGVASICGALVDLLEYESELNHQIRLAITAEEEIGLLGARQFSKGDIMRNASHLLIAEPTDLGVAIMEKGILWIKLKAKGKQAHASRPDLGINAIEGLSALIPELHSIIPDTSLPEVGRSTLNVGTFTGGATPNVVAELAEMVCDFRLTPGVRIEDMERDIEVLLNSIDDLSITKETINSAPAVKSNNTELGEVLATQVERKTGNKPALSGMYYATDAAVLIDDLSTSFAIFGPGSTELLHQTNERLEINQLSMAREIIRDSVLSISRN